MLSAARGFPASAAAVVAFFMAAVLPAATWPLIDGDVWWHLRAGREILASGMVARVDEWSTLGQGRPWTSQDWLANAAMAAVHDAGARGDTVLSLGYGLVTVVAFALLWHAIRRRHPGAGWASRVTCLAGGLVMAAPVLGVRVQVWDLLLSSAVALVLTGYVADRRRRWLVGLPVVAAAWANLHAGWPMLFLLGGAVLAGESADRLIGWRQAYQPLRWAQLRDLALALVAAVGALALNPNGTALWAYPFEAVGLQALSRHIQEWYPVTADPRLLGLYLGFLAAVVIPTVALGRGRLRTAEMVTIVGLTVMAALAVRFFLITGPLVAAAAAAVLAPRLAETGLGRRLQPGIDRLTERREGGRALAHAALAGGLVALGLGVATLRVMPQAQTSVVAGAFPVGAVAWLDAHEPGERIFNRYEWGGFLGFHRPHRLVFIDGRADVYGDDLLMEYAAIISAGATTGDRLDRYEIDHVVFVPGSALGAWLDASPEWERVYAEAVAAVWVRR